MKLLAYTSPSRGHLYPLLGILAELVSRGDECVACTLAGERGHVRAVGATGLAIDPRLERIELEDWRARCRGARSAARLRPSASGRSSKRPISSGRSRCTTRTSCWST